MLTVISLSEAQKSLLNAFPAHPLPVERVPLADGIGRYLAGDLVSEAWNPPFDRSTVDGYAVSSSEILGCSDSIPAILRVVGDSVMGKLPDFNVGAGEGAAIATGAALPAGTDAVVMVEHTEQFAAGEVAIYKSVPPGGNVIHKGEDTKPGQLLLKAGTRLRPADIGILAALGNTEVKVLNALKVALISTGNEIVSPGADLPAGMIYDVNSDLLVAAVKQAGAEPVALGVVIDEVQPLARAIQGALEAYDMLLVSGGTSAGEKDALPIIAAELGELLFHGVAVKPGKPTLAANIGGKPLIGLPGNPVAAFFIFKHLVEPLISAWYGNEVLRPYQTLTMAHAVASNHGREEFVLVRIADGKAWQVPSRSGLIISVSQSDGYLIIPRDQEGLSQGSQVKVYLL